MPSIYAMEGLLPLVYLKLFSLITREAFKIFILSISLTLAEPYGIE